MEKHIPQYLTEIEISKMTGIALSTLRNNRFLRRGIPYVKCSRSIRYKLQDVIDYMEQGRIETGAVTTHEK